MQIAIAGENLFPHLPSQRQFYNISPGDYCWRFGLVTFLPYIDSTLPHCDGCLARRWQLCWGIVTAVSHQRAGEAETLKYLFCNSAMLASVFPQVMSAGVMTGRHRLRAHLTSITECPAVAYLVWRYQHPCKQKWLCLAVLVEMRGRVAEWQFCRPVSWAWNVFKSDALHTKSFLHS